MEQLQKDYQRLWKRAQSSKCINDIQATIDLLTQARDAIQKDPNVASITLAKLQNPVKASFETTNNDLKEAYSGLNKYTKGLDKLFKDKPLPTTEYDALSAQPALVNRAIAMHLLREGQFEVANTFLSELMQESTSSLSGTDPPAPAVQDLKTTPNFEELQDGEMRSKFILMYQILNEITHDQNLLPAIMWARDHRKELDARGSNLEFELCRLQFIWLIHGGKEPVPPILGRKQALDYARREFDGFQTRYLNEIKQLMGAVAFAPNLEESPYATVFHGSHAWDDVIRSFTAEFCALLRLSAESPLYIAATAGAIALPTLLKLQTIMKEKRTEWTSQNELPVEIPLPPSYQYHSIFVCPVSKEQTTDNNPPMLMPCGHIIARESLMRLSKNSRFKCPYCPSESHPKDARIILL
ncbi:hypothetical protein FQN57_005375 [Myotisia sp. PD_48]|nr:hypothetical protein FQN57_005375 [Myotisia sp. PD_48]